MLIDVITGNASLKDWDAMIEQIREICYDQLTKEANEWYREISKKD